MFFVLLGGLSVDISYFNLKGKKLKQYLKQKNWNPQTDSKLIKSFPQTHDKSVRSDSLHTKKICYFSDMRKSPSGVQTEIK